MIPKDDLTAMALTMVGEARGEGITGMRCIAHVIMNRAALHTWYGSSPMQVCLKLYQFSCWNKDDPNDKYLNNLSETDYTYQDAESIAEQVLNGSLEDITDGATHYKVIGTPAAWAIGKTPCFTYKNHEFFKGIK